MAAAGIEYDMSSAISALIKAESACQTRQQVLIETMQETINLYNLVGSEARWSMLTESFENLKSFCFSYNEIHYAVESRADEVKAETTKTKIEAAKEFFDTFTRDFAKYRLNYVELEEQRDKVEKDKVVHVATVATERLKIVPDLRPKQKLSFSMTPTIWDDTTKMMKNYANESKFSASSKGAQKAFFDSLCELMVKERVDVQVLSAKEEEVTFDRLIQISDNLFNQEHTQTSRYQSYLRSKR